MTIELKIYDEKQQDKSSKKIDFSLKLDKRTDGDVALLAVDEDGDEVEDGTLLVLQKDGSLLLPSNVNRELGFKLDPDESIAVTREGGSDCQCPRCVVRRIRFPLFGRTE